MAENIINVTGLDAVDDIQADDTLLLIRKSAAGAREPKRIVASKFRGEDAYAIAKANGYAGSYSEWQALITDIADSADKLAKIDEIETDFNADSGEITITIGQ